MRTTAAIKDWLAKTSSTLTVKALCHVMQLPRLNEGAFVKRWVARFCNHPANVSYKFHRLLVCSLDINVLSITQLRTGRSTMSGSALSQRLAAFRTNFKQILGPKRQGYGELAQLEQPLVGAQESTAETGNDEYLRQHGVARPGAGGAAGVASQGPVPSQVSDVPDAVDMWQQHRAVCLGCILETYMLHERMVTAQVMCCKVVIWG